MSYITVTDKSSYLTLTDNDVEQLGRPDYVDVTLQGESIVLIPSPGGKIAIQYKDTIDRHIVTLPKSIRLQLLLVRMERVEGMPLPGRQLEINVKAYVAEKPAIPSETETNPIIDKVTANGELTAIVAKLNGFLKAHRGNFVVAPDANGVFHSYRKLQAGN